MIACRVCGSTDLSQAIDLGSMPLANNLLDDPHAQCERWPLRMLWCNSCLHGQLETTPPADAMFRSYCYQTGASQMMRRHLQVLAESIIEPGHRVLEIASNDGTFLYFARRRGAEVLGVDPAQNLAADAEARGLPTMCAYFSAEVADKIAATWGHADRIVGNNVLAHVSDPHTIIEGIRQVLAPAGVAVIEVPWVVPLLKQAAFDTIYHEHASYFSLRSLGALLAQHEMMVIAIERIATHGGSLRIHFGHAHQHHPPHACEESSAEHELHTLYNEFERRSKDRLDRFVRLVKSNGGIAGYGAAAKATVLLNAASVDAGQLPWIADANPLKQGKFVPGTRQAIVHAHQLEARQPDTCIVFPWNIYEEVQLCYSEYIRRGGTLISASLSEEPTELTVNTTSSATATTAQT